MAAAPAGGDSVSTLEDRYGFTVTLSRADRAARAAAAAKQADRRPRWDTALAKHPTLTPELARGPTYKKLIRKGVPPELRPRVWMEASGAAALREASPRGYYTSLGDSTPDKGTVDQVDNDLHRTFSGNPMFDTPEQHALLRRVLLAFARHNPSVGYCQSMNYLAGFLMIVVKEEEDVFWLLVSMMEEKLYACTHSKDLRGTLVEFKVLHKLVERKLPKLARHFAETETDLTFICSKWLLCQFCDVLPSETAARVWDCVYAEGSKVFHRVALAVLFQNEKAMLQTKDMGNIMRILQGAVASAHNPDVLLKQAFDGIGSLPLKRVDALRAEAQEAVDKDQKEREERIARQRALRAGAGG